MAETVEKECLVRENVGAPTRTAVEASVCRGRTQAGLDGGRDRLALQTLSTLTGPPKDRPVQKFPRLAPRQSQLHASPLGRRPPFSLTANTRRAAAKPRQEIAFNEASHVFSSRDRAVKILLTSVVAGKYYRTQFPVCGSEPTASLPASGQAEAGRDKPRRRTRFGTSATDEDGGAG
jgi:hypothetical protein